MQPLITAVTLSPAGGAQTGICVLPTAPAASPHRPRTTLDHRLPRVGGPEARPTGVFPGLGYLALTLPSPLTGSG